MVQGIKKTTESGKCNMSSCNGLIVATTIKMKENKPTKIEFGECKSNIPLFGADGSFCFVNKNSACPKISSESNPGVYISTAPCTEQRFVFLIFGIIASVSIVGLGSAVGVAYAIDPDGHSNKTINSKQD